VQTPRVHISCQVGSGSTKGMSPRKVWKLVKIAIFWHFRPHVGETMHQSTLRWAGKHRPLAHCRIPNSAQMEFVHPAGFAAARRCLRFNNTSITELGHASPLGPDGVKSSKLYLCPHGVVAGGTLFYCRSFFLFFFFFFLLPKDLWDGSTDREPL